MTIREKIKYYSIYYEKNYIAEILGISITQLELYIEGSLDLSDLEDQFKDDIEAVNKLEIQPLNKIIILDIISNINKPGIYNFRIQPRGRIDYILRSLQLDNQKIGYSEKQILDQEIFDIEIINLDSAAGITDEQVISLSKKKPVIVITVGQDYHLAHERIAIPGLRRDEMEKILIKEFKKYNFPDSFYKDIISFCSLNLESLLNFLELIKKHIALGTELNTKNLIKAYKGVYE